jgi:hypothetical protein
LEKVCGNFCLTKGEHKFQAGRDLSQINQYDFYQGYDGNMIVLQCSALRRPRAASRFISANQVF